MMIKGERIQLRAIELRDAEVLRELINDPDIETSVAGWSFPVSEFDQLQWIKNLGSDKSTMRTMIEVIDSKMPIGTVILSDIDFKNGHAEIHIKLLKQSQKQGFGKEALNLTCEYAFKQLRLNCIYASVNEDNIASKSLFQTAGFSVEGLLRDRSFKNGKYINTISLSRIGEK